MNIAVAGTGYVGMSIATLLAQHNNCIDYERSALPLSSSVATERICYR